MQIVGSPCTICSATVAFDGDAQACASCRLVFHRRCLATPQRCPTCGSDFLEQAQHERQARTSRDAADIAWGRRAVAAICVTMAALQTFDTASALFAQTLSLGQMIRILCVLGIAAALYGRRGWARAWFAVACAFGAVFSIASIWPELKAARMPALWPSLLALVFVASFWLLCFSKRVTLYFASRRGPR